MYTEGNATKKRLIAKEFTLVKPFRIQVRKRVIQSIPKGFVLLKPVVAGICGSDILYFKGQKEEKKLEERLPMCLLHEGVAEVVDVGERTELQKGAKVVVNPMLPCGQCIACRTGIGENLCRKSKYMASTSDGLARTLFVYPQQRVIPVPDGIELEVAVLTEPLSIALNAFEKAKIREKEKVAVIGDGPIGYLVALVTSLVGRTPKENLYLFGIIDEKLSLADDFAVTVNSTKQRQKVKELHESFDVIFEAAGGKAQETTLNQAFDLLKPAGRVVVLGLSAGKVPISINKMVSKGLTVRGCIWSRLEHYKTVIKLLKSDDFRKRVKRIICRTKFIIKSAGDLEEAFRFADTEEGGARLQPGRVMVYFHEKISINRWSRSAELGALGLKS